MNPSKFRFHVFVLTICVFLFAGTKWSTDLVGKVIKVSDGDTVTILMTGNSEAKIRFDGIDCPEKSQAYGMQAKQFTSDRAFDKIVRIDYSGKDRYGRFLGYVILPDGGNLNKELLKAGLAWHYKQYNKSAELDALEKQARAAHRGLWVDPSPMPPWQYRKMKRAS